MFLHNRAARRATAFVLTLMLVLTGLCFGGPESGISQAYGATDGEATVRILGPDNGSVITCAAVDIENGVTTVGAVVAKACGDAGRTFELDYGFPATIGGVTLPAGYYWMSMLNDSGTAFSHEDYTSVTVNNGDRIVLYADAYPSVYSYSYFTVTTNSGVSVMPWEDTSYITGELVLRLQQDVWGTVSPCADASVLLTDENGVRYSAADYGLPPNYGSDAVTTNSGNIKLALYGSCPTTEVGAYEKVFIVTSEEAGLRR